MSPTRSPCINVCVINPQTGWCTGCARTLAEIAAWPMATDKEKRAILASLSGRKAPPAAQ